MEGSIFAQSIELMIIGMGTVFTFLIILVFLMGLLEKAVAFLDKRYPQKVAEVAVSAPAATDSAKIALAIAAAKRFTN